MFWKFLKSLDLGNIKEMKVSGRCKVKGGGQPEKCEENHCLKKNWKRALTQHNGYESGPVFEFCLFHLQAEWL